MQHIITDEEVERFYRVFSEYAGSIPESRKFALSDFLQRRPELTLGKLRPIAEMPETVPEGCVRKYAFLDEKGEWCVHNTLIPHDTHCFDIQLPTPDPEAEERQRFEEAMSKAFPHLTFKLHENGSGEYANPHCETAWTAWKLAKAK